MADTEKKFSELTAAAVLTDADILAISQIDSATASLMSKRTTLIAIANKLASLTNYTSELTTQDKTLTGAINELKGLISLIPHFGIEVVQTLPTEDISETTIYMTPSQNPQTQDAYDEFIYVNDAWEHVGSTAVDLSAYYTKLEVDGLLATKANTADVSAALALKENTADMEEDVTDIVVDLTDTQETAEGNPVTLQTVQEGYAKAVTIKLTPKQDLHGYDKPWPAGGGKNKFDDTNANWKSGYYLDSAGVERQSGLYRYTQEYMAALPSTEYSIQVNKMSPQEIGVSVCYYDSAKNFLSRDLIFVTTQTGVLSGQYTTPATCAFIRFSAPEQSGDIQIEAGATSTAYEPYANICPIEGYEEASATRTGVNQWDEQTERGMYDQSTGAPTIDSTHLRNKNVIRCMPNTEYGLIRAGANIRVLFYDESDVFISILPSLTEDTFTTPANCHYIRFYIGSAYGTTYNNDISLNYPATDTDYHAYDGATATAEFAETIYGATGDAAGGDWEKKYFKTAITSFTALDTTATNPNGNAFYKTVDGAEKRIGNLSDKFVYSGVNRNLMPLYSFCGSSGSTKTIYFILPSDIDTLEKGNSWLANNPVEVCLLKSTPEPFQTAPAPLTLRKGDNTITTDGDSVKVKYNKLALPDIGGIGRYISALEARVAALEGNGNRSLSLMKNAPIETNETQEDITEEIQEEPKEETKNENTSESK